MAEQHPDRRNRRRPIAIGALLLVVGLAVAGAAGPSRPAVAAPTITAPPTTGSGPLTLADVVRGAVPGITATAEGGFDDYDTYSVLVTLENTGAPLQVTIPNGMLFLSDTPGLEGGVMGRWWRTDMDLPGFNTPYTVASGPSEVWLDGYGMQYDNQGGTWGPLYYAGQARAPLTTLLDTIGTVHIAGTIDDDRITPVQHAVYWLTDAPHLPVEDPDLVALFADFDAEAFARNPIRVAPDPRYAPLWARPGYHVNTPRNAEDVEPTSAPVTAGTLPAPVSVPNVYVLRRQPASSGSSDGITVIAILVLTAIVTGLALISRRSTPKPVPVRADLGFSPGHAWAPANWYPDPWDPGRFRWWDGFRWTDRQHG